MTTDLPAMLWSALREFCGPYPHPMKLYPEDAKQCLAYQSRITRCMPSPVEGEAGEARVCFFVRSYSGRRECFWVDTEAGEVRPIAFLATYAERPEHVDLEIGR